MVSSAATKQMTAGVDVQPVDVAQAQPAADSGFDPGAQFDQWVQALETFRNREPEERTPGVVLNGSELDYGSGGSFDDHLADKLEIPGTLVVAEHGMLQGDVTVTVAVIRGVFKGKITATDSVIVENHAVIIGEIDTPALIIQGGAIIEGKCHLENPKCLLEDKTTEESFVENQMTLDSQLKNEETPVRSSRKVSFKRVWRGRLFH
ncbi:MAG TPA: polymer-forming cytoskeletal protein [Pyrinomonadaceae bacterium]|nr:polymer-forming cytoskeletal protein [Pyrinomonadaceae bacterium]